MENETFELQNVPTPLKWQLPAPICCKMEKTRTEHGNQKKSITEKKINCRNNPGPLPKYFNLWFFFLVVNGGWHENCCDSRQPFDQHTAPGARRGSQRLALLPQSSDWLPVVNSPTVVPTDENITVLPVFPLSSVWLGFGTQQLQLKFNNYTLT